MKNSGTVIIARKRRKKKHAHHGGTWKIAYADFMTAMMAFFLVMWLLSQSTDMEREQIADYFRMPLKPALGQGNKTSFSESVIPGGGDDILKQQGEVFKARVETLNSKQSMESLKRVKQKIENIIETDPRLNNFKANLLLKLTNDGLLLQITDSQHRPMFKVGSEFPESYMKDILQTLAPVLNELPNGLSLTGHTDSLSYAGGVGGYSNWELSSGRANAARRVLVGAGVPDERFIRIIGTGSRMQLTDAKPDDPRNRRITILVLSRQKESEILNEDSQTLDEQLIPNQIDATSVRGYTDGLK